MTRETNICPQCLLHAPDDKTAQFCPRCGLRFETAHEAGAPMELRLPTVDIVVHDRLAFGDICNLYHCAMNEPRQRGVFKIARIHHTNPHVSHEASILRRLHTADTTGRYAPFLPELVDITSYMDDAGGPARTALALRYHEGVADPSALYTLSEVRDAYPQGVDARDMAWMWRRLLSILGYVHQQRLAHGAVTPAHVLIEPAGHKLVLIGWSGAVAFGAPWRLQPGAWRDFPRWEDGASPRTDLSGAARSMRYLLGGAIEPAIDRHLERAAESNGDAWQLLSDFDRVIEALWGPRQFRPFEMPARAN